jgi:hypothetical protein
MALNYEVPVRYRLGRLTVNSLCERMCDMKSEPAPKTVRRSVALPYKLIEEVRSVAPPELRENLNRLVTVALQDFVTQRKKRSFEESMAEMADDPAIRG